MWYLTSESDKRILYILQNKNITLGRSIDGQNCNFAIPDDPSISRKHASLFITNDSLFLKDVGSKYGTYINNSEKLHNDETKKLNLGDIVKFGKISCVWKVCKIDFVTCSSTLKGENLQRLKNILINLGGILKNDWDDSCFYLTMPAITLTIKVVLALVQNCRIVNVDYWNKCIDAINNNSPLPNPNNFVPHILESTLNKENVSFLPNNNRTRIFAGKKVIFFSRKQLEMYKTVLLKSSATVMLLSETKLTKSGVCDSNVIVIQYNVLSTSQETQIQRDQIKDIIDFLKSRGKRVVADAEIGLAVLYCSTSKYCNPDFNFSSEVIKQAPNENKPKNILALESQEPSPAVCKQENIFIDESLVPKHDLSGIDNNGSTKRKLSVESNDTTKCNKKIAIEVTKHFNLSLSKKRNAEEMDEIENPSKKIAIKDIEDDGEMFNFTKSTKVANKDDNVSSHKLNFLKPLKRKRSVEVDEDDLFNFINKKTVDKTLNIMASDSADNIHVKSTVDKSVDKDIVDLKALRGSKLNELVKLNSGMNLQKIKKEDISLDENLSTIDFGSTTLIIKKDLIVKREPLQIQPPVNGLKNFKKFKKVWPVKIQITLVTNSAGITHDSAPLSLTT